MTTPTDRLELTAHLPADRRDRVEARLRSNLMAWLTTVRPNGQPECVPVWYLLREDETLLMYSQPGKVKLSNIARNPLVAVGLDVTDIGRDIIRIDGSARRAEDHPAADRVEGYTAKYAERIGAMFGSATHFSAIFTVPVIITPTRLHA